ncbi:hypothetical protein LTR10_004102 [Elasticomyces elasticus]|nr:hypothetical protein LTR10_004102 [Elasticomyces elasticus]KAK4977711.1 hypothetical protein LTR42_002084 [Elasticomyces elasticus]
MSRFVSAGNDGDPPTERDEAWSKAQLQIEATKQQKAIANQQDGGKSLFDTLQANKAAKQEAFEEAARLSNQFRALDEDEVDFLESVSSVSRIKEAEVKKETREQLEAFRKQQEEAEKAARLEDGTEDPATTETWAVGSRKRKKGREKESIGGLKIRRVSTAEEKDGPKEKDGPARPVAASSNTDDRKPAKSLDVSSVKPTEHSAVSATSKGSKTVPPAPSALGLGAYSSDGDS